MSNVTEITRPKPCTIDDCGGLPSPETTDKIAKGLDVWDRAVLKQRTDERNGLATELRGAYAQLARATDALRKIRLGHPCDLHDLIAADALDDIQRMKSGKSALPERKRTGVCEVKR